MQLNIHDSTLKRIGFINNDLPDALHYFNDNWHRYLAEGTSTFDFSVNKVNPDYTLLTLQSYISFSYDDEDYLFNIINIQQDHYSMQLQCENLNLELISEDVEPYNNNLRHSIVWYLKNAAKITDNVVEIGNNPFSTIDEDTSNPILSFDSTETKLARIISICNSFKAEFQFKTNLKDDGTLQNITLDLYQTGGVGQLRKDVTLYYGKNIDGINSTGDRTSTFFNSTTVTDSNNKYNWLSIEGKYYNSDGQLEFYKDAGSNTAYAPLSRDMFPSQILSTSSDQYTNKNIQTSASSNDDLWDYAVSQFKLYAYPQMTYEVVVSVNAVTSALGNDKKLNIGDTIIVQDSTFDKSDGGLILSARVSEQEISFTNPLNNKITFTNFVKLKSAISADLLNKMQEITKQNTPYRSEIDTSNGVQFVNGAGSTTLTARIYLGADPNETIADNYSWTKDGTVVANVQEITVDASGISEKAVYTYQATVNGKVVGTSSVTITNVNDGSNGTDGKTSYTHVAWSYSADGTDRFTTVYPNLNLLTGTSTKVVQANSWNMQVADIKYDKSLGGDLCASVMINNADHASDLFQGSAQIVLQTLDKSGNVLASRGGSSISYNANGLSWCSISIDDNTASVKVFIFTNNMFKNAFYSRLKLEQGSTATPWMPSASEAKTSDYPSFIGQYTDFTQADSTNPSDYTWSLIRGNDGKDGADGKDGIAGKDGVGIKTTVITYAISTSGTTAPATGWTSQVPTLVKGQYLWTKTVWTYTDNSFETGYSVTYISKDGNNGNDGIAGKDGVGIKTTTITYAGSTSGTTAPTSGWTSTVPTVAAGSYLWTKTVWAYTDNTSETGYSVAKMGNNGTPGPQGPPGSNGDPGKIVSDTEPTTRFKGLTWKYLGTSDLTASDGTVILSGTEYYWSGTNWILSEINAHNINGDNLNVTNGTFTDGVIETSWKNGTVAGSTNIENDHLIITRTDSSVNTTNSIGLDSIQGLIMVYTDNSTGRTISVGTNFQGMFLTDSTGISASISPAGVKLSSDVVNWTPVGNITLDKAIWKRINNEITLSISSGSSTGNFPKITSSGTVIGTLPVNARPERNIDMPASGRDGTSTAQISINTNGEIKCYRWGADQPYFAAYVKFFASQ
nr:MAG TPA: tail protein [Caudoviricetes sp.]